MEGENIKHIESENRMNESNRYYIIDEKEKKRELCVLLDCSNACTEQR